MATREPHSRWALWRAVVPLLLVNAVAVGGQVAFGLDAYKIVGWPVSTFCVAAVAALTAESVSLYVNWHAHDALLHKATGTAARLRRTAYLIAGVVAALNYSHFAAGWGPTGPAVLTAMCSVLSPWLWGLHTRRAQRIQLFREGHADVGGAVFSAERFRWFPVLTLGARRWSIFHGVTDPRAAWEGYIAERAAKERHEEQEVTPPVKPPVTPRVTRDEQDEQDEQEPRPARHRVAKYSEPEHLDAARRWVAAHPDAPITTRRAFQLAAEIDGVKPGSSRAADLFEKFRAEQDGDRPNLTAVPGGSK